MSKNNDDNSNNTTNEKPFDEDTINKLIKAINEEDIPFSIKENESDNKDDFDDSNDSNDSNDSDDSDEPLPKKHTRKKISSEKKKVNYSLPMKCYRKNYLSSLWQGDRFFQGFLLLS